LTLRSDLASLPLDDADAAEERSWQVVRTAFAAREPVSRPVVRLRWIAVAAAVLVAALAALSPPGRAVLDSLREAIGVEHAQPALFSLPATGQIVASGPGGAWVIAPDGSKRRLGDYREASWSPFGHFVIAARPNELAALEPDGDVRWTLARPGVAFPRWAGGETDTRIAYLAGSRLHIVAGDGTADTDLGLAAAPVAPAWRPAGTGRELVLAYVDARGRIAVVTPATHALRHLTAPGPLPTKLQWSSDGKLLLVLAPGSLRLYGADGSIVARKDTTTGAHFVDAAFLPRSHDVAVLRARSDESVVSLLGSGRVLFHTTGVLDQVVPSPDGRYVLLAWPAADQWVFVPLHGLRISAAAGIAGQLGGAFPSVGGWCCATGR
jgi:hypothetical protein